MTLHTRSVDEAARLLRAGELVAFGTETVYGLGGDATRETSVAAIFEAKARPAFDPLIVHLADANLAETVTPGWTDRHAALAERFWPGPLTLLAPRGEVIGELVTSGLPDVALRVPALPATRELLAEAGRPIAAPSANLFGRVSPTTAEHVLEQLDGRIAAVFDTGPCSVGIESTVVRVPQDPTAPLVVLRLGGVPLEEIRDAAGPAVLADDAERGELQAVGSPGRLPKHYAPQKPLRLIDADMSEADSDTGVLAFKEPPAGTWAAVEVLSSRGDLVEAAANLFSALRRLDVSNAVTLLAERVPEVGLGRAINDRLRRAERGSGEHR